MPIGESKNIFPGCLYASLKGNKKSQIWHNHFFFLFLGHLLVGKEVLIVKSYFLLGIFSFNGGLCCCKPKE